MSNLPVTIVNQPPALSAEQNSLALSLYEKSFAGLGGNLRMITMDKSCFKLRDGGAVMEIPFNSLIVLFCGGAETNHAVWWEKDYAPGQTQASAPDLIWKMPTMDTFPDALPPQFRRKIYKGSQEVWAFQIRRRLGFVVMKYDQQTASYYVDFDHPYVMDISSASLFGQSFPRENQYKWGAIRDLCTQMSTRTTTITPFMFPIQIVQNPTGVQGTVLFKPSRAADGNLAFIGSEDYARLMDVAASEAVRDMLDVREKLTYGGATHTASTSSSVAPVQPTPPPAAPVQQPVQQPAPQPAPQPVQRPAPQAAPVAPQSTPTPLGSAGSVPPPPPPVQRVAQPVPQPAQPVAQPAPQPVQPAPQPQPAAPGTVPAAEMGGLLSDASDLLGALDTAPVAQVLPQPSQPAQPAQVVDTTDRNVDTMLTELAF